MIENISIEILFYAILALATLLIIMFFVLISLKRKYSSFIKNTGKLNIEDVLLENQEQIKDINDAIDYFKRYEIKTDARLDKSISKLEIKKYNAFEGMGGELSAIICMLDDKNNGIMLNIVHTGESNHIFTKEIKEGNSSKALSNEEKQVLDKIL